MELVQREEQKIKDGVLGYFLILKCERRGISEEDKGGIKKIEKLRECGVLEVKQINIKEKRIINCVNVIIGLRKMKIKY